MYLQLMVPDALEVCWVVPSAVAIACAQLDCCVQVAQVVQHQGPLGTRGLTQDVGLKPCEGAHQTVLHHLANA